MNVVVFGGGGFIGSAIVDKLLSAGYKIRVFERIGVEPFRNFMNVEYVEWMTGDFSSSHDIYKALEGMDAVIHLISTSLPKSSNDDPIYDVQSNLVSTLHLLNVMVSLKLKKIVFISSGGTVYGVPKYLPVDEQHQTDPICSYGITKLAIEKYLYLYKVLHDINPVILRVSNPYGEKQRINTAQGAVAAFIYKTVAGLPIEIWGDGSITRDYIYIDDVANAFLKAVQYNGKEWKFNISSGNGINLNDLILEIEQLAGLKLDVTYKPGRSFDVPVSILSNELAIRELGWVPKTKFSIGLEKTLKWANENFQQYR